MLTGGTWQMYVDNNVQEIKVEFGVFFSEMYSWSNGVYLSCAHVIATSYCTMWTRAKKTD